MVPICELITHPPPNLGTAPLAQHLRGDEVLSSIRRPHAPSRQRCDASPPPYALHFHPPFTRVPRPCIAGFAVQPLALRCPTPFKPPVRMPFPVNRPPRKNWPSDFPPPVYSDDPPSAADAVSSLGLAMENGTTGPYKTKYTDDESTRSAVERAIEVADAAGADPEKLRVAREVVASQAVPPKADRFW